MTQQTKLELRSAILIRALYEDRNGTDDKFHDLMIALWQNIISLSDRPTMSLEEFIDDVSDGAIAFTEPIPEQLKKLDTL